MNSAVFEAGMLAMAIQFWLNSDEEKDERTVHVTYFSKSHKKHRFFQAFEIGKKPQFSYAMSEGTLMTESVAADVVKILQVRGYRDLEIKSPHLAPVEDSNVVSLHGEED